MNKIIKAGYIWGAVGGTAMGMRKIREYQDRKLRINLIDAGVDACVGFIICDLFPIVTSVIVAGVLLEEWGRWYTNGPTNGPTNETTNVSIRVNKD